MCGEGIKIPDMFPAFNTHMSLGEGKRLICGGFEQAWIV
jgi:hypothetical protein